MIKTIAVKLHFFVISFFLFSLEFFISSIYLPEVGVAKNKKGIGVKAACPGQRDFKANTRIVGGDPGQIYNWPGLITFRLHNRKTARSLYFCGGTVISDQWVLTAAHCVDTMTKDDRDVYRGSPKRKVKGWSNDEHPVEVVLGTDDLKTLNPDNILQISQVIIHPKYTDASESGHDIALIKLASPWKGAQSRLSFSPKSDPETPPGARAMVAGFGLTYEGANLNEYRVHSGGEFLAGNSELLEVAVPTVSESRCRQRYEGTAIGSEQICAGLERGGKDSCQGDSGSALVTFDRNGCPYQVGVVSWGAGCAQPKAYGVYTRISAYAGWIKKYVPDAASVKEPFHRSQLVDKAYLQISDMLKPAKGRAKVDITEGTQLKLGGYVHFQVSSDIKGQLILLDINAKGDVVQLFPNKFRREYHITSGETLKLPDPTKGDGFRFPVVDPGPGRLVAIIAPEDFPAKDLIREEQRQTKGFLVEEAPTNYLMNLMDQILSVIKTRNIQEQNRLEDWAFSSITYHIDP